MIPAIFEGIPRDIIDRFDQGRDTAGLPAKVNGHRFATAEYAALLAGMGGRGPEPIAIYIHIPFCPVRCLYCACHTTITHDSARIDAYLDTLEREMDLVVEHLGSGRDLCQIHVGGGTPNYLSDSQLVRLMEAVGQRFHICEDTDTGIECNPRRCSAGQMELLKGLGFNRISFGVQDLDASVQHAIGRINSQALVRDVHATARSIGFETTCLDLIYGLPEQTRQGFHETLERVIDMGPDRVGCYSYSHCPATRPHQYAIAAGSLPSPREKLILLHEAVNCLVAAEYHWIGIDCFARDGDPLSVAQANRRLSHNCIGYTRGPSRPLLAFGASALGEVDGAFIQNEPDLKAWSGAVSAGQLPVACGRRLSEDDLRRRKALRHLLCNLELPANLAQGIEEEYERLARCAEIGLVEVTPNSIRVTPRGRYFLRSLCGHDDSTLAWSSSQWGVPHLA